MEINKTNITKENRTNTLPLISIEARLAIFISEGTNHRDKIIERTKHKENRKLKT